MSHILSLTPFLLKLGSYRQSHPEILMRCGGKGQMKSHLAENLGFDDNTEALVKVLGRMIVGAYWKENISACLRVPTED